MKGCPFAITEATAVLLLVTLIGRPRAGALRASVTSMIETPPGAIVEGVRVKLAIGGAGGSLPPGFRVSVFATGTSWRETPCASLYAMSALMVTAAGALTTAVGRLNVTDDMPGSISGTPQYDPGTRSPRSMRKLISAGFAWVSLSVAVKFTSLPPTTLVLESVSGLAPVKQASLSVPEFGPVMQPITHAWASVQLFVSNWLPFLHRYTAPAEQLSACVDPPQTKPSIGKPRIFWEVHFCAGWPITVSVRASKWRETVMTRIFITNPQMTRAPVRRLAPLDLLAS
jgi:hypothetical protein